VLLVPLLVGAATFKICRDLRRQSPDAGHPAPRVHIVRNEQGGFEVEPDDVVSPGGADR